MIFGIISKTKHLINYRFLSDYFFIPAVCVGIFFVILLLLVLKATLPEILKSIGDFISETFKAVGGVFESLGKGLKSFLEGGGAFLQGAGNFVGKGLSGVGNLLNGAGTGVGNCFTGVANAVGKVGGGIWSGIKDSVGGIWDGVTSLFSGGNNVSSSSGTSMKNNSITKPNTDFETTTFKPFPYEEIKINLSFAEFLSSIVWFLIFMIIFYYMFKFLKFLLVFLIARIFGACCTCIQYLGSLFFCGCARKKLN
jgi:hypothetical protein